MRAELASEAPSARLEMKSFEAGGRQCIIAAFRKFKCAGELYGTEMPLMRIYGDLHEFNRTHGTSLALVSQETAEGLLNGCVWKQARHCAPFPLDVIVGMERRDVPLGAEIVAVGERGERIIMPTHGYRGATNIALMVRNTTAAELDTRGRDTFLNVSESRLAPVENIRGRVGWRAGCDETGLPCEKPLDPGFASARELKIVTNAASISAPAVDIGIYEHKRTTVLGYPLLFPLGAIVEVPSYDVERLGGRVEQHGVPDNVRHVPRRDSPVPTENGAWGSTIQEIREYLPPSLRYALESAIAKRVRGELNNLVRIAGGMLSKKRREAFEQKARELLGD